MSDLFQNKSQLARLLAQENIIVEHKKSSTAYFDLENRTVVLPMWKDMDSDLYDLLMGHEVGHALYTPKEGWHSALTDNKAIKTYLNVIEDARIERKIKNQFPGITRSFNAAYKKLNDEDFFGIKGRDVSEFRVIDRINIFYKLGAHVNVVFTPEELKFIDRINKAESWDDVVAITNDVYAYAKTEKRNRSEMNDFDDMLEDVEDVFDEEDEDGEYDPSSGRQGSHNEDDLSSETDNAFRNNEQRLIDSDSKYHYVVNIPRLEKKSYLIPHEIVQGEINKSFKEHAAMYPGMPKKHMDMYADLIKRSSPTINYMIKEFEMRKNASQLARAKVAKSGKINPKKLARAGLDADIFQRITSVPEGKNHGMVMVIDLSGSMTNILKETFEQAIILCMFCKKLNIPFDVYGFNDSKHVRYAYNKAMGVHLYADIVASKDDNDIHVENVFMKHYLSSTMNNLKFRESAANMIAVGEYMKTRNYAHDRSLVPLTEHLNGTPLDEAIMASIGIVSEFKQVNKLEVVNTIFLTDGAGASSKNYYDSKANHGMNYMFSSYVSTAYVQDKDGRVRVKCNNLIKKAKTEDPYWLTRALVEAAEKLTGAKYTGYYIGSEFEAANMIQPYEYTYVYVDYVAEKQQRKHMVSSIREEGFIASDKFGFSEYYFVMNKNLKMDEELNLDIAPDATKVKIAKQFMKAMNGRGLQRIFLSRFVQNIAA